MVLVPLLLSSALGAEGVCERYDSPERRSRLHVEGLTESSGVVQSRLHEETWYTHNDSGGAAELFPFTLDGEHRETISFDRDAWDWEDLAAGACPGGEGSCIYVGDIGDNPKERPRVWVHAFRELEEGGVTPEPVASWRLAYPEGARNAEALLHDPIDGRLYIVTKRNGPAVVYRLPEEPGEGVLEEMGRLEQVPNGVKVQSITAGEFSQDGGGLVLRSYLGAFLWRFESGGSREFWNQQPERVGLRLETQGEAIAFARDGSLVTTSEGDVTPVTVVPCRQEPSGGE